MAGDCLVILPPLKACFEDGRVVLTRKFVEGAVSFARSWQGGVKVLAEPARTPTDSLDNVRLGATELGFAIEPLRYRDCASLLEKMRGAEVVLANLDDSQSNVARLCATARVPCVYVSENSLATRRQMVRVSTHNPLVRLRRNVWTTRLEGRLRRAVTCAAGVQCNGTPTYEAYRSINPSPLLFFDSRVTNEMLASDQALEKRIEILLAGGPLRLAFSGRLVDIKGVDHLPLVAAALRLRGVPFVMEIYGGGELEARLHRMISEMGLQRHVRLRGVADFATQLIPAMSSGADLFVCCHRQGDPSCTYLETMSCGTPIVGYDNEAFRGVAWHSGVGWTTPLDDPRALAERIAQLDSDRAALATAARAAKAFAARHSFEETMRRRVEHLLACAGKPAQESCG
jgi:glycosyltransferase involved in cell wall biosynthesis